MELPWVKRPDLAATRHDSGGWVVKDPLGLRYALLDETEFAIFQLLDGHTSFANLMQHLHTRYPARRFSAEEIIGFVKVLAGHELIRPLYADLARQSQSSSRWSIMNLVRACGGILRFQVPLVNPSGLIDRLLPSVRRLINRTTIIVTFCLSLTALAIVLMHFRELVNAVPSVGVFLGPNNLPLVLSIFVVVKVLHEAGHAFAARHFGAECNECGIMMLVMTPVLYTNVTDSWTLPRRQRLMVTGAGLMVELFIAAVCSLLWWSASDGVVRSILLNTVLLCSINTVLFNGNPLLRFDGYFLLADVMGIPNLSQRSAATVRSFFTNLLTGVERRSSEAPELKRFLLGYGLASLAYRIVITMAIVRLVNDVAAEWHAEFLGAGLTVVLLTGAFVIPFLGFVVAVVSAATEPGASRPLLPLRIIIAIGLIVTGCLVPLPRSIILPVVVQPGGASVFAESSGHVVSSRGYGQAVTEDEILVTLNNPELSRTKRRLLSQVEDLKIQLQVIERDPRTSRMELVPSLREAIAAAEARYRRFCTEMESVTIRCERSGMFVEPPDLPGRRQDGLPSRWEGAPAAHENLGAWIDRGTLLGYVGHARELKLTVCVPESDIEDIEVGQTGHFRGRGGIELNGNVRIISREPIDLLPATLGASGLLDAEAVAEGYRPVVPSYLVTMEPEDSRNPPACFSVGRVRIDTEPVSLFTRLVKFLRRSF